MKHFLATVVFAVLVVSSLCFVSADAFAKNPTRPFKGRSQEMLTGVPGSCQVGAFAGSLWSGSGNATHLGLFTSSGCTATTGGTFPLFEFVSAGVATAANGDQVSFTITGSTNILNDPCVATGTLTVVGGTGRFAGATGEIDATSLIPWTAPYTCGLAQMSTLVGTIAY